MKQRIIILSDLSDEINIFSQILESIHYKLIKAENETNLFDLIEKEYPHGILISSNLKDKDTYLICKKIKLLEAGENIPIIIINGQANNLDRDLLFNSGANDYINYPISTVEIVTKISHQIQLNSLKEQLKERTNQLQKIIPHYQKLKIALEKAQKNVQKLKTIKENDDIFTNINLFKQTVEKEWLRASRQRAMSGDAIETSLSLIIAQLTDFDLYQDNHQPEIVASCIKLVNETLASLIKRPGDIIIEFQEGKFGILLPNTNTEGAQTVAEKIQAYIESLQIPHNYSQVSEYFSLTVGIATGIPTQGLPPNLLIDAAEDALNRAIETKTHNAIEIDYV